MKTGKSRHSRKQRELKAQKMAEWVSDVKKGWPSFIFLPEYFSYQSARLVIRNFRRSNIHFNIKEFPINRKRFAYQLDGRTEKQWLDTIH